MSNEESAEHTEGDGKKRRGPVPGDPAKVVAVRFSPPAFAVLEGLVAHQKAKMVAAGVEGGEYTAAHLIRWLVGRFAQEVQAGAPAPPAQEGVASSPRAPAAVEAPRPLKKVPAPLSPASLDGAEEDELRAATLAYQKQTGQEWKTMAEAIGWQGALLSQWARGTSVNSRGTLRAIPAENRKALVKLLSKKR